MTQYMERLKTIQVRIGKDLLIGGGAPIVVQTMCNTHTSDVDATVAQCLEVVAAGAQMVRINPGNFHPDHDKARSKFAQFLEVCREHGTAIRVGVNHGSLGKYITEQSATPRTRWRLPRWSGFRCASTLRSLTSSCR